MLHNLQEIFYFMGDDALVLTFGKSKYLESNYH